MQSNKLLRKKSKTLSFRFVAGRKDCQVTHEDVVNVSVMPYRVGGVVGRRYNFIFGSFEECSGSSAEKLYHATFSTPKNATSNSKLYRCVKEEFYSRVNKKSCRYCFALENVLEIDGKRSFYFVCESENRKKERFVAQWRTVVGGILRLLSQCSPACFFRARAVAVAVVVVVVVNGAYQFGDFFFMSVVNVIRRHG